jgi:hypothetical protein
MSSHVIYKQFLPEGKASNFVTRAGKFIEVCFDRGAIISRVGEGTEIPAV